MKLGEHPAFPRPSGPFGDQGASGMTLRQYYAALAMQGLCANQDERAIALTQVEMAKWAVAFADALLAELEK